VIFANQTEGAVIGYLGRLIPGMPRGVGHIAFAIFKEYNLFTSLYPSAGFDGAATHVLKTRKATYKKTTDTEIDFLLGITSSIGDLITIAIIVEDPSAFDSVNEHTTMSTLNNFYRKYCPHELRTLQKIEFISRKYYENRDKHGIYLSAVERIAEYFVVSLERSDHYGMSRALKYLTKIYVSEAEMLTIAKRFIEYINDGDVEIALSVIMPLFKNDIEIKQQIDTGIEAFCTDGMQPAFDELVKAFRIIKRTP